MSTALITTPRLDPISFNSGALAMKELALEQSAGVARVTNPIEQAVAVAAQIEIEKVLKYVEASRVEFKTPFLEHCRLIDATAKDFVADLLEEKMRLGKAVGNHQTLEQAKARAAEAARVKELNEIERRRQEQRAQAASHEELDRIDARSNQEAAALPVQTIARSNGQVVKDDWEITVTNPYQLAAAHPTCVTITPKTLEIKALLKAGITPAGIIAKQVVKSGVRLSREPALIEA